ncbi:MAG: alcohol dehydrogenase catalytic domain-containing protein [Acidimicrobiales bacterium]|nr:alcohol dehydrogenase catalytic domain-containing protein [Acidimicrobiales bacterium]
MDAWILDESPGSYRWGTIDTPEPGPDEVRVRVVASALNHMDLWVTRGMPKPHTPHVPGADGAGVIDAVGAEVGNVAVGDEVVINPAVACRKCGYCLAGDSPFCKQFGILGEHRWGMHGEFVVVPGANVAAKPASLGWAEAAAFPLCWLTAWRMLKRARLNAADTMIVVGVGGGVSTAGLVLGVAAGATVYATSRDQAKRDRAVEMGAVDAFDSGEPWPVQADVVFENVGAATWNNSIRALRPGGRVVTCGGTAGSTVEISLPRLFFKQHEIIGSTMGSYAEFDEVLKMVAKGLPVEIDQVYEGLDKFPEALTRLEAGDQSGKIVIQH